MMLPAFGNVPVVVTVARRDAAAIRALDQKEFTIPENERVCKTAVRFILSFSRSMGYTKGVQKQPGDKEEHP
jgi:hypothetical protein